MAEYFMKTYSIAKPLVVTNCPYSLTKTKLKTNNSFDVLYHGIYSPGRGIEELIASAPYLNNRFRIILRISYFGNKKYIEGLIEKQEAKSLVIIKPPVAMSRVVDEASSSHIGVVFTLPTNTNHVHTVSNKIFDYINAGLPVLMSDAKEHEYLNNKYNFGIVIKNLTPANIAQEILALSQNRQLFEKLSLNCKRAAKDLNWKSESKKLLNLYEILLKK
jgi:glycosyltransferase involved in cell wall biosynthesis